MSAFSDQYGPWALIAGASMGIGRAFSHEAASRGLNVAMVARGAEALEETATEVRDQARRPGAHGQHGPGASRRR